MFVFYCYVSWLKRSTLQPQGFSIVNASFFYIRTKKPLQFPKL
ncbi:hypothetical protein [Brochothrix phage ADU4]|nr:hypothetical protein [Brochothrix phage ADU4]